MKFDSEKGVQPNIKTEEVNEESSKQEYDSMKEILESEDIENLLKNIDKYPNDVIHSEEILEYVKDLIRLKVTDNYIDLAIQLKEKFKIKDEDISDVLIEPIAYRLQLGQIDIALDIKDKFHLTDISKSVKKALIEIIQEYDTDLLLEIKDRFNLSFEVLSTDVDINKAAIVGLNSAISGGNYIFAEKMQEMFNLPKITIEQAEKAADAILSRYGSFEQDKLKNLEELKLCSNLVESFFQKRRTSIVSLLHDRISACRYVNNGWESLSIYRNMKILDPSIKQESIVLVMQAILKDFKSYRKSKENIKYAEYYNPLSFLIKMKDALGVELDNNSMALLDDIDLWQIEGSERHKYVDFLSNNEAQDLFPNIVQKAKEVILSNLFLDSELTNKFLRNLPNISDLDNDFVEKLIRNGKFNSVVNNPRAFKDTIKFDNKLAHELLDSTMDGIGDIGSHLEKFSGLDIDIAFPLIENGWFEVLAEHHYKAFGKISESDKIKILQIYLSNEENYKGDFPPFEGTLEYDRLRNFFTILFKNRDECKKILDTTDMLFRNRIWFSSQFTPPLDPVLSECVDIFTLNLVTEDQYLVLKKLFLVGEITPELKQLGVTKTGHEGLRQLREKVAKFRQNLTDNTFDTRTVENPIIKGIFKSVIRFENSQWGSHEDTEFKRIIGSYNEVKDDIEPLPNYMKASEVVRVDTIDKKAKFEWSEQFLSRYNQLLESIAEAKGLIDSDKKPLTHIAKDAQAEVEKIVSRLEEKLAQMPNPKAKIGIQQRIDVIKALKMRNVKDFQHNFKALSQFKELHPLLRKVTFAISLLKNKQQKERVENELLRNRRIFGQAHQIKIDETSTLLDFVDHITNKETMLEYFDDRKAKDVFLEINGVKAIQEELARVQNQDIAGTMPMQFVPVRNLLTEFSGHIADACWASKYNSILSEYPNFTSVIFVKDPKGKFESFVGACFLIETESEEGEPLLVIRGLNPQENVINRLSVNDFFNKFTAYVKDIAAKDGRKVALVTDNHSGGSGTNRPILFEHMKNLNAPAISLASNDDTNFNRYNIVNDCVLVN